MGWIIVLLLCIGALYQWRHTDFVKAIITTLVLVVIGLVLLMNSGSQQGGPRQVSYPTQQR